MNKILNKIIEERNGHYCHCIEVNDKWEIEAIIEGVIEEYPTYAEADYIRFFESIDVYCLDDDREEEVYNFNFREYIQGTI